MIQRQSGFRHRARFPSGAGTCRRSCARAQCGPCSPDHILDVEGVRQNGSRVLLDAILKPIRDAFGRITAITAIMG